MPALDPEATPEQGHEINAESADPITEELVLTGGQSNDPKEVARFLARPLEEIAEALQEMAIEKYNQGAGGWTALIEGRPPTEAELAEMAQDVKPLLNPTSELGPVFHVGRNAVQPFFKLIDRSIGFNFTQTLDNGDKESSRVQTEEIMLPVPA